MLKRDSNAIHPSSLVNCTQVQSGQAESWAKHTAEQLGLAENKIELLDIQELTIEHLQQYQRILWVVSTYLYRNLDKHIPADSIVPVDNTRRALAT